MRHYKKRWLVITCLLISTMMFSQSRDKILSELGELLESNNNPSELFYNVEDKVLDIYGYQIDLFLTDVRYEESDGAMLGFQCKYAFRANCIYNPKADKYFEDFTAPMKDKESVYKAINLINQLDD